MSEVLNDPFIMPDLDRAKATVTFTAPPNCRRVSWRVLDKGRCVRQGELTTTPNQEARFVIDAPDLKPWNVNTPNLYQLELTWDAAGGRVTAVESWAMRKIHVTSDAIYVNNERFFARGYIRGREAHDHPNLQNLPLEEYYAKNIRMAKMYGFNLIRFHSRIPPKECFDAADKLGIFIHIEMRKYYGKYQKERQQMMDDEGQILNDADWREMILSLRNHPSLLVYCMGNEIDHPGRHPRVPQIYRLTKELDPTRLFLDTCSRGEFDRSCVDFDVQHMSYFYPFGRNYGMFEDTQNWLIYGSCKDLPVAEQDREDNPTYRVTRAIPSPWPVMAHEICHCIALRDLDALDRKFEQHHADKPWWIAEVRKLVEQKGLTQDYPRMMEASQRFQFLGWKLGIEAARRSRLLSGFHFLQFSDTERYENANGVVDCFDDPKGADPQEFLKFNGDTALLADLPRRTYFEGETVMIPIILSHFSAELSGMADFRFSLRSADGAVEIVGGLQKMDLNQRGRREICRVKIVLPAADKARALTFRAELLADGRTVVENSWNLWLYPNRPKELSAPACTVALDEVVLNARYPQVQSKGSLSSPEKLVIVNRFSKPVFRHLENGGDVLMLYRVPETRDRKTRAPREEYSLPTTWDRFKGVIWDRGTNCGAFIRPSKALEGFPTDGFMDMQFAGLVDDCDKVTLDDFPAPVAPIIQGVDKPVRDRFDVYTYKLSELQPLYTMRKFGYLFELRVGKGRLLLTGLNFTGLASNRPEVCAMFESLLWYVASGDFQPTTQVSVKTLEDYLLRKSREPLVKERRMTQYWQLDEEPLESKKYWKESIEYLGIPPAEPDKFLERKNLFASDKKK